jgi:hypothetical protein
MPGSVRLRQDYSSVSAKATPSYRSGEGRLALKVLGADAALIRTQLRAQHNAYDGYFGLGASTSLEPGGA